jgi:transcriptional regulator with XRE-family HTH domain
MDKGSTSEELLTELCQDEEFRKEYKRQRPYYDLILEIIRRRKALGLTQKELAEKANTKQSCISRIESGEHNIRLGTLIEVAEALESSVIIHLVHNFDESNYALLFKANSIATQEPKQEYTSVTIDHKIAETKA